MRVCFMALLAALAMSACSAPRKSVAELETPRSNAARAVETPAPDYPYTWRPRQLPKEPACYDAAMCYDEKRKVCVLFGGSRKYLEESDLTFTWDGKEWQQRDSWNCPEARCGHALVYDPTREVSLLIGGRTQYERLNDSWEWDGLSWRLAQRVSAMSPRDGHSMAYDSRRGVLVLFGGSTSYNTDSNETWELKDSRWQKRELPDSPPARSECAMAFDEQRQRIVLYGGRKCNSSQYDQLGDTWEYDGENWRQISCETTPGVLSRANLVYDKSQQRLLLIAGGYASGSVRNSDVWTFDGTNWREMAEVEAWPLPRTSCAACFDSKRNALVVHGGWSWSHYAWNDTWELQNNRWSERRAINTRPIGGWMVYDEVREKCVLIGMPQCGFSASHLMVWEWDGYCWQLCQTVSGPNYAYKGFACFDPRRRIVVLFLEREQGDEPGQRNEVWAWDGAVWSQPKDISPLPQRVEALVFNSWNETFEAFGLEKEQSDRNRCVSVIWTLHKGSWRKLVAPGGPPTWDAPPCAFNHATGETVFVGYSSDYPDGKLRATTWRWRNTTWQRSAGGPDIAVGNTLVFDIHRRKIVCFGGGSGIEEPSYSDATWEWDGDSWSRVRPLQSPCARCNAMGAFDKGRGVFVMFGGEGHREALADTWEYGPDKP